MDKSGKTHGCLIAVIVFLCLLIAVMVAVFFIFFKGDKDSPDVKDIIAEVENSERTTDNNSSITDIIQIQPEEGAVSKVTITLTNADLTALINDAADSNDEIPFEDLLLSCNDDETVDITGVITDLSMYADADEIPVFIGTILKSANGKRVYATVFISYEGDNEFEIVLSDVRIGKFSIPTVPALYDALTNDIEVMLRDQLETQPNFEMQEFRIEEDKLSFSGLITE